MVNGHTEYAESVESSIATTENMEGGLSEVHKFQINEFLFKIVHFISKWALKAFNLLCFNISKCLFRLTLTNWMKD